MFDEADRMLDMGFDKDVKGCTDVVREQVGDQFKNVSIVLAAATTGGRLTDLVKNIMSQYVSVGFETDNDAVVQVPSSIEQLYAFVPSQFRLHVLLSFLYCKRNSKVIVFTSTCQCVNFLCELIKGIDWQDYNPIEGAKKESVKYSNSSHSIF